MTSSKILFFLCLSFIAGIFLESLVKIPQISIWGILIFAFLIVIIFMTLLMRSHQRSRSFDLFVVAGFCLMFLILGILRMQISEFNIANDKLSKFNGKEVVLEGFVAGEPDLRDKSQRLKIKIDKSIVLVTTNRYPEYNYLDKLKLSGKLEEPGMFDDFIFNQSYKNYLMKDHIYSVMNFPKIEKMDKTSGSPSSAVYSGILFLKQKLRQSIRQNFSPPESSILEGTILGDNGAMANDLKNKLNITGLRHIIAVSGTHVVILSSIIMSFLLFLRLSRDRAFYVAIIFICFYIILTGLPPSGIRAGIMGGLYLLSQKIGRQTMGPRIIAIACAAMLLINPLYLFYDVGFQLSFLAVLGLIYLEPIIKLFFKFIIKQENLISMVSATLSAQIFTLPIMIFNFGNISFVSPITNFLVSIIVSPLMIFGFISSIFGIFSNVLGFILSVPSHFLLLYFVWVINFFSQPWAMLIVKNVSWLWLALSYLIISSATYFLRKKYLQNFL